jgi:hypothetical protein
MSPTSLKPGTEADSEAAAYQREWDRVRDALYDARLRVAVVAESIADAGEMVDHRLEALRKAVAEMRVVEKKRDELCERASR